MSKFDWLIELLQGNLDSAEKQLAEISTLKRIDVLNLLAIKLLRREYTAVINIAEKTIGDKPNIHDERIAKILEYRLAASILSGDDNRVLDSLRKFRVKIFMISMFPILLYRINSWYDFLDEQKIFYIHRQISKGEFNELPLSKSVIALLTAYLKSGNPDKMEIDARRELISYIAALMAHTPLAREALSLLNREFANDLDYNILVARGKIFFLLNNPVKALSEFNKAITFVSEKKILLEALVNISQIYAMYGEYRLALDYARRALLIRQDPIARLVRGGILLNMGRFNEAILAFKALLRIENRKIKLFALLGLAECYVAKGNFRAAFDAVWKAYMLDRSSDIVSLYVHVLRNALS